jgi:hypothetical protein
MSKQVYIGKVKSDGFDYYKEYAFNERVDFPERLSREVSSHALFDRVNWDVLERKDYRVKRAGYGLSVVKLTKTELIKYLSDPEYKEEINILLSAASVLPDSGEYLLAAYESADPEERDAEDAVEAIETDEAAKARRAAANCFFNRGR